MVRCFKAMHHVSVFVPALIADPRGPLAKATSYIPFMSPLVLTFWASINALPVWEQVLGIVVTIAYVVWYRSLYG
ncbi:MAG: hypothetical protein V1907_02100 [Candidatus Kerfeldbacteria bacterium]